LALVLDGRAGPGLLDSYSAERQPVGAQGVQWAITSLGDMAAVDTALGYLPDQSAEEGWAALSVLDEAGPDGDRRRAELREAVALTDYQFNAHGLELGYRYSSGALVPDPGTLDPPPDPDAHLRYQPTTRSGARVPHARLERDGKSLSTLDLVDGLGFALLTGPGGQRWAAVAAEVAELTGVPIGVHVIGRGTEGPDDPYGDWEGVREVSSDGCVLVRPDRHVAWRREHLDPDATTALTAVVDRILSRDPRQK
jgi:2,4-dichlorophenol 6-monooxygenase